MADQSCFLDVQEFNGLIKKNNVNNLNNSAIIQHFVDIQNNIYIEDRAQIVLNTDPGQYNEEDDYPSPYFTVPETLLNSIKKIKPQPFLSTISRQRLLQLLKKDGFSQITCIKEQPNNLILKSNSFEMNQNIILSIHKGMKEDYQLIMSEYEKIQKLKNSQFILKCYKILFYEELFVYVIIFEMYEQSLQDEIDDLKKKKCFLNKSKICSLFFQLCSAITETSCYNIFHNNINPQNIMKIKDGVYKLSGFGTWLQISKQKLSSLNSFIDFRYIPPEIIEKICNQNIQFSNKSDVYSISAIILDILIEEKKSEHQSQTQSTPLNSFRQSNHPGLVEVVDNFKRFLLSSNPSKRLFSYQIIPSIQKYLQPNFKNYQELIKYINDILSLPTFDQSLNMFFIKKAKIALSNIKIKIIKYLDNQQSILSLAKSYCENGKLNEEQGYYQNSLVSYLESLNTYEKMKAGNSEEIVQLLRNIAQIQQKLENYKSYNEFAFKSLEMVQKIYNTNHMSIITSLQYVSWSFHFLKQGEKALDYALRALQMRKELTQNMEKQSIAYNYDTVGAAYQLLGNYNEALKYFLEGLSILKKECQGDNLVIAASLNNIGVAYEEQMNFEKSLDFYQQAQKMYLNIYGYQHSDILQSKKGIFRSLQKLEKEQELQQIQIEIQELEKAIQKQCL